MIVSNGDVYIPVNGVDFPIGVLFVERGFEILKLKGMTITDALIYLDKNNIPFYIEVVLKAHSVLNNKIAR